MNRSRLAVLADFPNEGWPSMDLCADMLLAHWPHDEPAALEPTHICPPFHRLLTRLPTFGKRNAAFNADRLLNRFVAFPRHVRRIAATFDAFHVVDHSYAHLVHALPADRVGVYCHDVDAFRCLFEPTANPRPRWFRAMARRILTGLQKAAMVFHSTTAVRECIIRAELINPQRLIHAPYGVAAEFTPNSSTMPALPWLDKLAGRPWVLHVGSCIPRKRIDILLDVVAAARKQLPDLQLVKVGGEWSADHRKQITRLGLNEAIIHVRDLTRQELAEAYRRASAVLVPSEAEGFGLPVIEALACGAAVLASDIPALREAGGLATLFAPMGNVAAWTETVTRILTDPYTAPSREIRLMHASRFTWTAHAQTIAQTYHELLHKKR